jgi:biotin transport system substrate-specific component
MSLAPSPSRLNSFAFAAGRGWLSGRPLSLQLAAVLLGTLVLAASSQVQVPMIPVPMTMQTLAVTLVGAFYGWRLGSLTVLAWLLEGALGMPVFAGGGAGLARFMGPTGGYLLAFPLVAALTGWLAERGWTGANLIRSFASMLTGNLLCLAIGGAWLAAAIGWDKALSVGVLPFLMGGVLKSVLAAALLKALHRKA